MTEKLISKGLMLAISLILSCTTPLAYAQTSQPEKITVTVSKKPLENVLEKLSKQYGYQFFYNASLLKGVNVSVSLQEDENAPDRNRTTIFHKGKNNCHHYNTQESNSPNTPKRTCHR